MRAVLLLTAIAACRTPPARPAGPQVATGDAAPAPCAGASAGYASSRCSVAPAPITADAAVAEPAPAPVTDAECVRFVEHTLELGMAQQRATKPSDYVPTADQVVAIRARLIASRPCDELSRAQWACALEATTQGALYGCAQ